MTKLNIAPTKSNLLAMKEQLAVSTNGYELLEEKREILVRELMHMVEQVKVLEKDIEKVTSQAYPALKRMLMMDGADQIERISHAVHYDFEMTEKKVTVGGMPFSSIDVSLPKKELSSLKDDGFAEVTCQFCDKVYRFSEDDLTALLQKKA